jgi:hypothetical protein
MAFDFAICLLIIEHAGILRHWEGGKDARLYEYKHLLAGGGGAGEREMMRSR